jgi:hypothetical protein
VVAPAAKRIHGVVTCRARRFDPRDATVWRGIPVTTLPRTLVDLAEVLSEDDLARAVHEADVRYRVTTPQIEKVLARRPSAAGTDKLRRVLRGDVHITLSRLESAFLNLLREAGLPLPRTNRVAGTKRVDCRWPDRRLTVELDSYRYHSSRHSWEQDRFREREARARGDEFRRYTWGDLQERRTFVLAELRPLIA